MRSSTFLTEDLSSADIDAIREMALTDDASFSNLLRISGFNPKSDFVDADLREMDFTDADLRGFNFSGADLRGSIGENVTWDSTTILDNAALDGSFFARQEAAMGIDIETYQSLRGAHWTDQVIILERELQRDDLDQTRKMAIASALYSMARDSFVRRNALRAMSRLMAIDDLVVFLKMQLYNEKISRIEVLGSAVQVIDDRYRTAPSKCLSFLVYLLNKDHVAAIYAATSIARNVTRREDMARLAHYIKLKTDQVARRAFIAELAARLGPVHAMLVEDRVTNDVLDFNAFISDEQFATILKGVNRRLRIEALDQTKGAKPFTSALGYPSTDAALVARILELYRDLERNGVVFSHETVVPVDRPPRD
ncbi:pentapeptide repeat-containing protein [Rhizobium ruizarguesonis]|uniref:pentapeptide repeat-containing protein n=1 Tax=Rhizobium ruizarguesonis TaxID=2081791 RepID=UPI0013EE6DAF|nr:pentapeptide repeat-containing protein [Rhizobium ruizarguesonis]